MLDIHVIFLTFCCLFS